MLLVGFRRGRIDEVRQRGRLAVDCRLKFRDFVFKRLLSLRFGRLGKLTFQFGGLCVQVRDFVVAALNFVATIVKLADFGGVFAKSLPDKFASLLLYRRQFVRNGFVDGRGIFLSLRSFLRRQKFVERGFLLFVTGVQLFEFLLGGVVSGRVFGFVGVDACLFERLKLRVGFGKFVGCGLNRVKFVRQVFDFGFVGGLVLRLKFGDSCVQIRNGFVGLCFDGRELF